MTEQGHLTELQGFSFGFGLLGDGSYRFWLPRRIVLADWSIRRRHWRADRKRLARLRSLYWILVRNYETEICQRCGGPVRVVFHAPDAIWQTVTGHARYESGESAPGVLCPPCVDDLADEAGLPYLRWTCSTDDSVMRG